ncbi:MAG: two-component regulator propeller domain-containing protein [Acidobacteriota bacterium]
MTARLHTKALLSFALTLFLALPLALGAQERAFELSQQSVLAIHADGDDLWIGTEDGLNHVRDGQVTQYRHDARDSSSLPANKIRAIAPGPSGTLWIAVANRGVVLWDVGGWVVERRVAKLGTAQGNDPRALLANEDGSVWAGFARGGLELIQADSVDRFEIRRRSGRAGLVDGRVTALARAADGKIWVGTPTGVDLYNPSLRRAERCASCTLPTVRALRVSEQGLWVGTGEGTFLVAEDEYGDLATSFVEGSTTRVNTVSSDSEGRVWVGTASGLLHIDTASLQAQPVALAARRGGVLSIHEDRDGAVWLGTMTGGLQSLASNSLAARHRELPQEEQLVPTVVTSFAQSPSGHLFVGTMDNGLMIQDPQGLTPRRLASERADTLAAAAVMTLLYDQGGHLWVGTKQAGLSRFDAETGEVATYRADEGDVRGLPSDGVMSLFEDAQGVVWVGTFGGGLARFEQATETFRTYTNMHGLRSNRITTIAQALDGGLWVGTLGGGLHLLDERQRVTRVFASMGDGEIVLPDNTVYSVYETQDGTVWVGTPGGLTRLERFAGDQLEASSRTYTEADGLSNAAVYSIVPDDNGYLWLSTNSGLSRFDPTSEVFEVFDESLGFQREYNFGAALKARDGRLLFGGMDGFDAVDPNEPVIDRRAPQVVTK